MIVLKRSFLITFLTFFYFSIKPCGLCELFEYKINLCELPNEIQVIIAQNILQNEPEILYPLKVTEPERTLLEHNRLIFSADFINDNEIITSTLDGEILLYNLELNTCKKILSGKSDLHMHFVTISLDKKFMAFYSNFPGENEIKIFQINSSNSNPLVIEQLCILKDHEAGISCVKFSEDSKYILSTSWDSTARLWDLKNGKQINILDHRDLYKRIVLDAAISKDNKNIVTICEDMVLRIWEQEKDFIIRKKFAYPDITEDSDVLIGYNDMHINFTNNNEILISKNNDGKLYIFDIKAGRFSLLNTINLGKINSTCYNKKMDSISYSEDKQAVVYLKKLDINLAIFESKEEILNAQSNENNKLLLTTSKDKKIKLWNIPDFQFINIKQALFIKFLCCIKKTNVVFRLSKLILSFPKKLQEACKEAFLSFNNAQKMLLKRQFFLI